MMLNVYGCMFDICSMVALVSRRGSLCQMEVAAMVSVPCRFYICIPEPYVSAALLLHLHMDMCFRWFGPWPVFWYGILLTQVVAYVYLSATIYVCVCQSVDVGTVSIVKRQSDVLSKGYLADVNWHFCWLQPYFRFAFTKLRLQASSTLPSSFTFSYGFYAYDTLSIRKPLEFEVGDRVLLMVSPWKGVIRFGTKVKLASSVHDTFHVSNLKKCLADANLHVPLDEIKIDKTLRFVEEPVEIMDREVRSLKRSKISLVKFCWNLKRGPEFTWEREDHMKSNDNGNDDVVACIAMSICEGLYGG
nr:putative reverse transcriptase domain-containing protein [Tanacetum cinerariifolium]